MIIQQSKKLKKMEINKKDFYVCKECLYSPPRELKTTTADSWDYCSACERYGSPLLEGEQISAIVLLSESEPCDCGNHIRHNNGGNYHYDSYKVLKYCDPIREANSIQYEADRLVDEKRQAERKKEEREKLIKRFSESAFELMREFSLITPIAEMEDWPFSAKRSMLRILESIKEDRLFEDDSEKTYLEDLDDAELDPIEKELLNDILLEASGKNPNL